MAADGLHRMAVALGAALAFASPAAAQDLQANLSNYVRLPDGHGLVGTVAVDLAYGMSVEGWDIAVEQSAVLNVEASTAPRVSYRGLGDSPRPVGGLHDLRISATRSIPLPHGVQLDLLGRATLPTGKSHLLFGAGRTEALLDAGLRKDFAGLTVWLGGARRFRRASVFTLGRDVNEFYAGVLKPIDDQSSVRLDYLLAGSELQGGRRTSNLSLALSRDFGELGFLELNASRYRDSWVESTQGLLSVRVPTRTIF